MKPVLSPLPAGIALAALIAAGQVRGGPASGFPSGRRAVNFLLITVDTLRADRLGCYGSRTVKTPNMDRLAEKGGLFSRAFAHTTTTLPSHANILLGSTPLVHGVHENAGFVVGREFLTLAEFLKAAGYATAAVVGAFPLDSRFGLDQGFDLYDDDIENRDARKFAYGERRAEVVVTRASAWLRDRRAPWFLWVHLFDPHHPYEPPEPFLTPYRDRPYDGEVAYTDAEIGRLLEAVSRADPAGNTLIILTSDHGEALGEHGEVTHGFLAYNPTLWVPLIVASPGGRPRRIAQTVSHIDIFPTVCDILGLETPTSASGRSLAPALAGRELPGRPVYFESLYPYYQRGWAPLRGVVDGGKKLIASPIPELYDLSRDFDERVNLAGRAGGESLRRTLDGLLAEQAAGPSNLAKPDARTRETLASLGYISGPAASVSRSFGPADDVKVLLPFYNRTIEASDLHAAGGSARAAEMIKQVIAERPDLDVAYVKLAAVYKDRGRAADAIEVLKQGLAAAPWSYEIFATTVNELMDARRYRDVVDMIGRATLRQMEYDPEIWNYLGLARLNTGDAPGAESAFRKALSIDGGNAAVHTNLGLLHLARFLKDGDNGAFDACVLDFRKAIDFDPKHAMAYNGLGAAFKRAGRIDDAVAAWEKALAIEPGLGAAVYNLAVAHLERGDKAKSLVLLRGYLEKFGSGLPPEERREIEELLARSRQ